MSTNRWKASRYNHFVPTEDGNVLAFNAVACGLGQMDRESYEIYQRIAKGEITDYSRIPEDLFDNLKKGDFLIPETRDEFRRIKVDHHRARFGGPELVLTIIPTLECNFACDYCYEPGKADIARTPVREKMKQEVQDGLVKAAKSLLQHGTGLYVTWYGGEPLLGLEVIRFLTGAFTEACEEKNCHYRSSIITNGYLFTPEVVKELIDLKVSYAQITLDGPEEVHDARRPLVGRGPTFKTIVENIERLPEDVPFSISIRVNVDERNRDQISNLLGDLKKRGLHNRKNVSLYFSRVTAFTYSCRDVMESCMMTAEFASQELGFYEEAMKSGFTVQTFPARQIGNCGAVRTRNFVVEPDGTLQTCWTVVGRKDTMVGEIADSSFRLNDNYDKWLSWSAFEKGACADCSVLPICMGGCPYESLFQEELPQGRKRPCVTWKYNLKEMMKFFTEAHRLGLLASSKRQLERSKNNLEPQNSERR